MAIQGREGKVELFHDVILIPFYIAPPYLIYIAHVSLSLWYISAPFGLWTWAMFVQPVFALFPPFTAQFIRIDGLFNVFEAVVSVDVPAYILLMHLRKGSI